MAKNSLYQKSHDNNLKNSSSTNYSLADLLSDNINDTFKHEIFGSKNQHNIIIGVNGTLVINGPKTSNDYQPNNTLTDILTIDYKEFGCLVINSETNITLSKPGNTLSITSGGLAPNKKIADEYKKIFIDNNTKISINCHNLQDNSLSTMTIHSSNATSHKKVNVDVAENFNLFLANLFAKPDTNEGQNLNDLQVGYLIKSFTNIDKVIIHGKGYIKDPTQELCCNYAINTNELDDLSVIHTFYDDIYPQLKIMGEQPLINESFISKILFLES